MPRWDDFRGPRHDLERNRWRRDQIREPSGSGGDERRSFDPESRRPEPERTLQGRRYQDAGAAGYAPHRGDRPMGEAYGEHDYGAESEGGFGGGDGAGPDWGFGRDSERRRNFDMDDPGVGQSQAGYGQRAQTVRSGVAYAHPDHDFDPDYLRWRNAQMRGHDRDYQDWRREQHRLYDDEYRRFRSERQRHFGQAFHEWRSQRSAVGGVPDTGAAPSVSGAATPDGDRSAEFGTETRPVQAASKGDS